MPVAILPTPRGPSAFLFRDAEGAPASNGLKYHAALDWFAPGGTAVHAPTHGRIVEVKPSSGSSGQIFGGTVKLEEDDTERVFVCRHVTPEVVEGQHVQPGATIARVTHWTDGPDHVHLEVWRLLVGGYRLVNMIDPGKLDWTPYTGPPEPAKPRPPHGNSLRLEVGSRKWAGWEDCEGPIRWIAAHGLKPNMRAAIAWRQGVWRGPERVTNVCVSLVRRFL